MDTSYIKEFVTLAECMSFSEAANRLFISQSSLSKHIKAIEKSLGTSLFERTTRSISLTEAGASFLEYALEITDLLDKAQISVENIKSKGSTYLTFGTMHNPQYYDLAKYMLSFHEAHPEILFQMVEDDEFGLYEMYKAHMINLFPTFEDFREDPEDYFFMRMVKSRIDVIMKADHPLAAEKTVSLNDLTGEHLLLPARSTTLSRLIHKALKKSKISPDIIYEGSSSGSVDLVKAGMGISLHAEEFSKYISGDKNIKCVPIEPEIKFTYGLAYRDPSSLSRAEQLFLTHLKKFEIK